jgi:outer membrane protein TolC
VRGEAARGRLRAGEYETSLRLGAQKARRKRTALQRVANRPGTSPAPAGAEIDRRLGRSRAGATVTLHGDAIHETSRALLKAWFAWGRENAVARQWREQVETLKEQLVLVEKRVRAGDAPRLEAGLAEAALASAESTRHQADLRERMAANELTQGYADITLPASLPLIEPVALERETDYWRNEILAHSHELAVARIEAQLARTAGERAEAERTPDPALGLNAGSGKSGNEHTIGVSLSIPFSGAARSARAEESLARAEAAGTRGGGAAKIRREADNTVAAAQSAWRGWEALPSPLDARQH